MDEGDGAQMEIGERVRVDAWRSNASARRRAGGPAIGTLRGRPGQHQWQRAAGPPVSRMRREQSIHVLARLVVAHVQPVLRSVALADLKLLAGAVPRDDDAF